MSRTDKDVPYRIHLRDGYVEHDHRFGPCDLELWEPPRYLTYGSRSTRCRRREGYSAYSYADTLALFPRTRAVRAARAAQLGAERVDGRRIARAAITRWRAGAPLDADELEPRRISGRHAAQWEAW